MMFKNSHHPHHRRLLWTKLKEDILGVLSILSVAFLRS